MATLDDKLMGEKLHYYCSSSEDEDEEQKPKFVPDSEVKDGSKVPVGANTGPKGVIRDWRRFKQLERENRENSEKEKLELAKKLALTCRSERQDKEIDDEIDQLLMGESAY